MPDIVTTEVYLHSHYETGEIIEADFFNFDGFLDLSFLGWLKGDYGNEVFRDELFEWAAKNDVSVEKETSYVLKLEYFADQGDYSVCILDGYQNPSFD